MVSTLRCEDDCILVLFCIITEVESFCLSFDFAGKDTDGLVWSVIQLCFCIRGPWSHGWVLKVHTDPRNYHELNRSNISYRCIFKCVQMVLLLIKFPVKLLRSGIYFKNLFYILLSAIYFLTKWNEQIQPLLCLWKSWVPLTWRTFVSHWPNWLLT